MDTYCPFVIRLEQIKTDKNPNPRNSNVVTNLEADLRMIEEHVQSYMHFTDFIIPKHRTWEHKTIKNHSQFFAQMGVFFC